MGVIVITTSDEITEKEAKKIEAQAKKTLGINFEGMSYAWSSVPEKYENKVIDAMRKVLDDLSEEG